MLKSAARFFPNLIFLLAFCLCAACSQGTTEADAGVDADAEADADGDDASTGDADIEEDGDTEADAETDAEAEADADAEEEERTCVDMSERCASDFGSLFFRSNGRADGTLWALVDPMDRHCTAYNDNHVVLQLLIDGQVQRLVVAIEDIAVHAVSAPLIGPEFEEGWHTGMDLDYARDLGAHSDDFRQVAMEGAAEFICLELELDEPVSVYAYSDGDYPSSAHQIHRNDRYPDGAIVARPTSENPLYLLFRYQDQEF